MFCLLLFFFCQRAIYMKLGATNWAVYFYKVGCFFSEQLFLVILGFVRVCRLIKPEDPFKELV